MRRITTLVTIVLFATPALRAQSSPAYASRFAPLEFLVGSCWRGTFPGATQTDEHCFEWVYDRKFVRDRHVVRGGQPYSGETIYFWDDVQKRIGFSYWNTEGQMMPGFVVSASGDSLPFSTSMATKAGITELRSIWNRRGTDGYRVTHLQRTDGAWKPIVAMEMNRAAHQE